MHFLNRLASALILFPTFAAAADASWIPGLKQDLAQRAKDGRFSGAVLVKQGGATAFTGAWGEADREQDVANSVNTRFRFGSMGKMFTGVAIAQLAQAGKLDVNAPLGEYLRDYPNAAIAKATLHELLTHTAGTGDIFGPEFREHRAGLKELRDYVALYGQRAPAFTPGSRHEYSNYGYILLGRVIEVVSGQGYDAYVREHIFLPAGMKSTDNLAEDSKVSGLAVPYTGHPEDLRSAAGELPYRGTSAGGGYSTVGDLSRFADALLSHHLLDEKHTTLVLEGKVDTPRRGLRYAYGFEDATLPNGLHRVGHGGGAPGMNGLLAMFPEIGLAVVVLANQDPPAAMELERVIVDTVTPRR
jgi:CubicO group peptidase (beta-lactamase class C family)